MCLVLILERYQLFLFQESLSNSGRVWIRKGTFRHGKQCSECALRAAYMLMMKCRAAPLSPHFIMLSWTVEGRHWCHGVCIYIYIHKDRPGVSCR